MNTAIRHSLAVGLLSLGILGAQAASAQPVTYVFEGPDGPTVLQVDAADRPIAPPRRPDLVGPAIPVPQVMNGGGFGITGYNYYDEGLMEGRTGPPRGKRHYVLAPAWFAGYGQH